jgi:hypothetical protein
MSDESNSLPVAPGTRLDLELHSRSGEVERLSLTVVADEQADFAAGLLGAGTPLARALMGHLTGEVLPYTAGDLRSVKILAVAAADGQERGEAAARRAAAYRRAVEQAEFTNAVTFASSVDTKWGEYDPEGLDPDKWAGKPEEPGEQDRKDRP